MDRKWWLWLSQGLSFTPAQQTYGETRRRLKPEISQTPKIEQNTKAHNTVSKTAKPDNGLINQKPVANDSEREYKQFCDW